MSLWETKEVFKRDKLNQKNVLVSASAPNAANTFQGQVWFDTSGKRVKVAYETAVTDENVGTGDGATTTFYLDNAPVRPESETVYVDGVAQTRGTDYTVDYDAGAITFTTAPASGAVITADYAYYSWKLVRAENLTEIPTRNHADLQNIGANDHHTAFAPADHDARDHSAVAGTIALSELGSKAHSELTGIGVDDHHAKLHQASHQKGGEDALTGTIYPTKVELGTGRVFECIGGNGSIVIACQDGSGRLHIYWNAYYDSGAGVHKFIKAGDYAGWLYMDSTGKWRYRRSTAAAGAAGETITWGDETKIYDGKVEAPNGIVVQDANLYRSAANVLKTDDNFEAGGYIKAAGVLKGVGYKNTSPSLSDQTANRALGTVYQNTTGKTLVVYANVRLASTAATGYFYAYGYLGETAVTLVERASRQHINGASSDLTVILIVPDQWKYEVYANSYSGTPSIVAWFEQTL